MAQLRPSGVVLKKARWGETKLYAPQSCIRDMRVLLCVRCFKDSKFSLLRTHTYACGRIDLCMHNIYVTRYTCPIDKEKRMVGAYTFRVNAVMRWISVYASEGKKKIERKRAPACVCACSSP